MRRRSQSISGKRAKMRQVSSLWARNCWNSAHSLQSGLPQSVTSCTEVTPWAAALARARRRADPRSASLGFGMTASTRRIAASFKMPVGSPLDGSRKISPPQGSGVAASIPAARRAALLARPICRSLRLTNTGLLALSSSIHCLRGSGASGQVSWSQPPPVTHSPGFAWRSRSAIRPTNSAGPLAPRRLTDCSEKPPAMKWVWASMNPGSTVFPPRSLTAVCGNSRPA